MPFDKIFMRKTGDKRKDSIVKKEIYENNILNRYNVTVWLDDRNQVVNMLRDDLNLNVWQVNNGDF